MAKNDEPEKSKDTKAISDSEQNYPRNIITMTEKAEGEEFTLTCPILGKKNEPIFINFSEEPTSEGYLAKKKVFEYWMGDTAFGAWLGRTVRTNANNLNSLTIVISKLTLKDKGYYFCEYLQRGQATTKFSDLNQLTMWAKPTPPQISGKPQYYANTVKAGASTLEQTDFTQPQSILECRTKKGYPKPKLTWIDQSGAVMPTGETVCYGNEAREELFDCSLSLEVIVTEQMDNRQFTCQLEHETLYGEVQTKDKQINVLYPPVDVGIKGNRTTKTVTCSGRGNPKPEFEIQIGQMGTKVPITDPKGSYYIADLATLNENDLIFCHATNGLEPHGENHGSIGDIFAAEPLLATMHWIIIAAAGGALLIVIIILIACCCCKKKKDSFNNQDKKRGAYQPGQNGSMNMVKAGYGQTMASNVSYNFRQPDGQEDPKSQVEDYLRRAQSKEQLMADYDHASSHPSEVYHDQLQRTREMISRSRENLDYIEEQSAIEVTQSHLQAPRRTDSFDDYPEPDPPAYPASSQYNQYVPQSQRGYGYNDEHLYQNDPQQNQQQNFQSYQDDGPPPPPRNQSVRLV